MGRFLPLMAAAWLLLCAVSIAHTESGAPVIPDVEVLDQEGVPHRFYTELIQGRTVAINFLYASCKTSCPAANGLFSAVQHQLRADPGRPVTLLSLTVDPLHDRPAQLKALAEKFGAGPKWMFLTGTRQDMTRLLSSLGVAMSNKVDHPAVILVGNDAAGAWTRLYGQVSVPMVTEALSTIAAAPESPIAPPRP